MSGTFDRIGSFGDVLLLAPVIGARLWGGALSLGYTFYFIKHLLARQLWLELCVLVSRFVARFLFVLGVSYQLGQFVSLVKPEVFAHPCEQKPSQTGGTACRICFF